MSSTLHINGSSAGAVYAPYGQTASFQLADSSLATQLLWEVLPPKRLRDGAAIDAATNWPGWTVNADGSLSKLQTGGGPFAAVTGKPDVYHSYTIRCTETRGVTVLPPVTAIMRVRDPRTGLALPGPAENTEADPLRGWWGDRGSYDEALARRGQIRVYNGTGSTLAALKVCKIGSAVDFRTVGGNANPGGSATETQKVFSIAQADPAEKNAQKLRYCILEEAIANGAFGWAVVQGDLSGNFAGTLQVNRKIFSDLSGDIQVYPVGKTCIEVGTCVDASSTGRIAVDFVVHRDGAETEPSWFGADEDLATNDLIAIQQARLYAKTYRKNKSVNIAAPYLIGTSSATIGDGATLNFKDGGSFTVSDNTLVINSKVAAGPHQIFFGPVVRCKSFAGRVNPKWWGADATGVADSADAIQYAIDCSVYFLEEKDEIRLPAGTLKTSKTVHLGYGDILRSVRLSGAGQVYNGDPSFSGTTIKSTFANAPAIAVQGNYHGWLKDLTILGLNRTWVINQQLGLNRFDGGSLINDKVRSNWIDPTLLAANPNMSSRYAPNAGLAIDPYRGTGTAPTPAYPTPPYPDYSGMSAYNGAQSSGFLTENVDVIGFDTAIVIGPHEDGNGDFITFNKTTMECCKWGLSIGNTQSRNVGIYDCRASRVHTVFTNNVHGVQAGKFGGPIQNFSVFGCIQLFQFGTYYASPVVFDSLYCESLWRLGDIDQGSADGCYIIRNSEINLTLQDDFRGVPANILGGSISYEANVRILDTTFSAYPSVVGFNGTPDFDGSFFRQDTRSALYEKYAHNLLCGGAVCKQLRSSLPAQRGLKTTIYNLNDGTSAGVAYTGPAWPVGTRSVCIPLHARYARARDSVYVDEMLVPRAVPAYFDKSALASCSLVDKTLTLTFASRTGAAVMNFGPEPGDVLWDDQTGSVFFVRSRSTLTVIAELQNNYISDGAGGFDTIDAFSTSTGNFYIGNSRLYTPPHSLRGDITSGSNVITNARGDDGYQFFDSEIAQYDSFFSAEPMDAWLTLGNCSIAARSQAAETITLFGNATRTQLRRRLDFFVRLPPANA